MLCCVALVARPVIAGTATWIPDADGLWISATNWSTAPALPGAADDVSINVAGDRLITLDGSDQSIHSLVTGERVVVSGVTLTVAGTAQLNNIFKLTNGATLKGGTYSAGAVGGLVVQDGTLDALTVSAPLDLTGVPSVSNSTITIRNGLTLNSTATLGRADGSVYAYVNVGDGSAVGQTLGGTGTVALAGYSYLANLSSGTLANGTLTIGSGLTVRGGAGAIYNGYETGTILNRGTIWADGTGLGGNVLSLGGAGLVVNQGTLKATGGGSLFVQGMTGNVGVATVSGVGSTLSLSGDALVNNLGLSAPAGTTLAVSGLTGNIGTATVNGAGASLSVTGSGLVNNLGLAAPAGTTLGIGGTWSNPAGASITANGATLNLGDDAAANTWNNAGTITANNSTVNLGGSFTQATLGAFNRTGGTVNLTGTLTGNLALTAATGSWNLAGGGTLKNGTYSASGGAALLIQNGVFDGVTANAPLDMTGVPNVSSSYLTVLNNLTLNGTTLTIGRPDGSAYGAVSFGNGAGGGQTLGGTGTVVMNGSANLSNTTGGVGAAGTLTIGPSITVRGAGTISNGYSTGTLVNKGLISADVPGPYMNVYGGAVVNQGTLRAVGGGALYVSELAGDIGVATVSGAGSILSLAGNGIVNNLGLAAPAGTSLSVSGLAGNIGTATVSGAGASLSIAGSGIINNQGLSAPAGTTLSIGGTWTNPVGKSITANTATLNLGDNSADNTWSNAGTISATSSTVNLGGSFTQATLGTFNRTGGTVNLTGTLTGNVSLTAATGNWTLTNGGTIRNGTYSASGGAALPIQNGTFDGVTANAPLDLTGAATGGSANLRVLGNLTLNGTTMTLGATDGSSYGTVTFGSGSTVAQTLGGTGTVTIASGTINYYPGAADADGTLTFGAGVTIHGGNGQINNPYDYGTILNKTVITADVANTSIYIGGAGTLVNQGTLKATGGGSLIATGLNGNIGLASVSGAGSGLSLAGTGMVNNLGLTAPAGTTLALGGAWTNPAGVNITATSATLSLGDNAADNTWNNAGIITATNSTVNLGGSFTQATLGTFNRTGGTVNLTGTLTGNLALTAATGSWNILNGGTLKAGTYTATGGAGLTVLNGATFDGVTANAPLDLTGIPNVSYSSLTVLNGLTLNATATLGRADNSVAASITFGNGNPVGQTLGGTGTLFLAGSSTITNFAGGEGPDGTLTVGQGITIHGGNSSQINNAYSSGTILNKGTISADAPAAAGPLYVGSVNGGVVVNQGTLKAVGGGSLVVNGLAGNIGVATVSGAGGGLSLAGTAMVNNLGLSAPAGTTLSLGGTWTNPAGQSITATSATLNLGNAATDNTWSNAGTITASSSTVNLGGSFTQATLGTFNRTGGTVNLTGTLSGNLALTAATGSWNVTGGGTIRNGTYTAAGGAGLIVQDGTMDGVNANGALDLTGIPNLRNARLAVYNDLTLNAVATLGRADATASGLITLVTSDAGQTLAGNGTVLLAGGNSGIENYSVGAGDLGTLTIGPAMTVHGSGFVSNDFALGTIVNKGVISADVAGGTLSVGGFGTLTNQGTLKAINGATLSVGGAWSNAGTITAINSTLNLGGTFTTAGLGVLNRTGGTVNLTGTLDNTAGTLTLDAARGSWNVSGAIVGGNVNLTGGSKIVGTGGTLTNVAVSGDIDVVAGLTIDGGSFNGTARVSGGALRWVGSHTLVPSNTIVLSGGGSVRVDGGATLTVPAGATVRGGTFDNAISFSGVGDGPTALVNNGLISATDAGSYLSITTGSITNNGAIEAVGGALYISGPTLNNNGILRVNSGTLQIAGTTTVTNSQTASLVIGGGTAQLDAAFSIPALNLSVGELSGTGEFGTPALTWTGGTMSGSGKTTLAATATFNISGTGVKTLARTIDNAGAASWSDGQVVATNGVFNNLATGSINVTAANSFFDAGGGNAFNNAGVVAKNSSSITIFSIPFNNLAGGKVNVNDGTLVLSGGGTNAGAIEIAAGATARFGGNYLHTATSSLISHGNIDFNAATISLDGNVTIDGELSFNSASATVKAGATANKLSLTGSSASVAAGGVLSVGSGGVNFGGSTNNTVTLQPAAGAAGMLVLKGNVNVTATDGTAALNTADFAVGQTPGTLDLFAATRTFSVNDGLAPIDLAVSARVANGAVVKTGAGTMRLDTANPYTGGTTVSAGTLQLLDPGALGSGAVTLGDATLSMKSDAAGPVIVGNAVSVTGDATINVGRISLPTPAAPVTFRLGALTLGSTRLGITADVANLVVETGSVSLAGTNPTLNVAGNLTVNGPITQTAAGKGFTKSTGLGTLRLGGSTANAYTGVTRVNAGAVELNKPAGVVAIPGDLQVFGGQVKSLADQQIADTATVTLANAGTLLDFAGHSETIGALSISGNASATVGATGGGTPAPPGTAVLRVTSLNITTGGRLDLANNRLIDDYTGATPITSVRAALQSAYAGGGWGGPGLAASSAAFSTRGLAYAEATDVLSFANGATSDTFLGSTVDRTTILTRYTLAGDANLDGAVDFLDLARLAQNYNVTDGARLWIGGDFNYDGNVDFLDLAMLAQSYNTALPGAPIPGATADFDADLARAFASVPEPSSVGVLALCCVLVAGRTRRRLKGGR